MTRFSFVFFTIFFFLFTSCSEKKLEIYGLSIEKNCDDGIDNDGDGKTDCDDTADCSTADNCCVGSDCGDPETNCTDKVDNDNDGAVDCADADCNDDPACNEPKCGNEELDVGEGCDGENFGSQTCANHGFTGGYLTCISCHVYIGNCSNDVEPICGNGIQEDGEQCDRSDFNGQTCISRGFDSGSLVCTSACRISTANCQYDGAECGDGICEDDEEETCPADCESDPVCGNGIMESGEGCDGNDFNGRTCAFYNYDSGSLDCRSTCTIDAAGCYNSSNPENCSNGADDDGDGFIDCDDVACWGDYSCHCGNDVCESAYNETVSTCPADCDDIETCGNGVINVGEACDGNAFGGYTCSSYGFNAGTLSCSSSCVIITSACYNTNTGYCGNGVKDSGELCDGNAFGGLTCSSYGFTYGSLSCINSCGTISTSGCYNTNTGYCGNGVKDSGELCDGSAFGGLTCSSYGFTYGSLSCINSCGTISTSGCYNTNTGYCGNGVKDSGELCDGNAFGGLTCVSYGFDYGSLLCINSCGTISTANCYDNNSSSCGNGSLESGEQCDSNTFPNGLGCDDYGFSSGYLSCGTGCTVSTANCYNPSTYYCGNGVLNSGEGCDGSYFGGKTCSTFGYDYGTLSCNSNCTVNTSSCYDSTSALCGNGVLNSGEACDNSLFNGKTCSTFGYSSGYLSCSSYCTISTSNCSNSGSGSEICNNGLDDDSDGLVDFLDANCSNTGYERYCSDGIDNDFDGDVDCWDQDCIGSSSCRDSTVSGTTFLAVMPREGVSFSNFGCDGTDNTGWLSDYCTGTALMFNCQVNGRWMFAYTTSSCSAQNIINYGISWEAFNFLAVSPYVDSFDNMACYVGCSVNPQTGLRTQANGVCVVNKYNSNHIAQLDTYFGTDRIEIHSGSIASYLYWYVGIDPQ